MFGAVFAAAGATFLFAGLAVIKSGGTTDGNSAVVNGPGYALILALLLTCFGAVASWVAFGPGEREFQGEAAIGGNVLPVNVGELLGRILFSPGALLLDFMALAAWFYFFRGLVRRVRGRNGAAPKPHPPARS